MKLKYTPVLSLAAGAALIACSLGFMQTSPAHPPGTTPFALRVPPGFPAPALPADNPLTVEGVRLGQRLFNEVRLSGNNTQACASCHLQPNAFADPRRFSVGIDGIKGTRNASVIFNLVYARPYFWDGRAGSLRSQSLQPIQNPIEMHANLSNVVQKLQADSTYQAQFAKAFGSPGVTSYRMALAFEQFMISVMSGNSKFDQWRRGLTVLTPQEQRGFHVFRTPFDPSRGLFGGDCARCHGGPLFADSQFRNNGLDAFPKDIGRMAVTGLSSDRGKFKTPSLRNVAVSAPYMHDGRFTSLEQVVQHYSEGIQPSTTLDPGLARQRGGVRLSLGDQAALVAFMRTLTDPQFAGGLSQP